MRVCDLCQNQMQLVNIKFTILGEDSPGLLNGYDFEVCQPCIDTLRTLNKEDFRKILTGEIQIKLPDKIINIRNINERTHNLVDQMKGQ